MKGAHIRIVADFVAAVRCPNCCFWLNREENESVVKAMVEEDPVRMKGAMHRTHLLICGVQLLTSNRN